MRRGRARPKTTETTVSIPVDSLPLGAQAANAFAGWVSPATSIVSLGGANAITASDRTRFIARTVGMSRDQEMTMNMYGGCVYLRWTPGGRGIYFSYSPVVNVYELKVMDGVTEGLATGAPFNQGPGTSGQLYQFTLPTITTIPGYSNSPSNTWTIGVEGFDLYLKFNGVEFWRTTQFWVLTPGYMGLGVSGTGNGIRTVTATHKISRSLHSDLTRKIYDIRDFGMKSMKAVGSIDVGVSATTLNLTSNPGFVVGDRICIPTGGEAGGGVPGERGVGGQWPSLMYATTTARDSDTTQVVGKVCGVLANGNSYQWTGSTWGAYTGNLVKYLDKIVPKALIATITTVAGDVLTLDTAATVSTTNANVYFDSGSLYDTYISTGELNGLRYQPGCTISIPAGDEWVFAGKTITLNSIAGLRIVGSGMETTTILSPTGVAETGISTTSCDGSYIANMQFVGNTLDDKGYMFRFNATTDAWSGAASFVRVNQANGPLVENIRGTNYSVAVSEFAYCTDAVQRNIEVIHETGHKQYFQWAVNISDSLNCVSEDIYFDGPWLFKGLESFRSNGSILRRATGRNFIISSNSNTDLTIEDCSVVYEAGCADSPFNAGQPLGQIYPDPREPLVNLNSNIDNTSGSVTGTGIQIINCDFDVQGRIWTGYGGSVIAIAEKVNNVRITGRYPAKPVASPSGRITTPTLGPTPYVNDRIRAVACDSNNNITLDGVRIAGTYEQSPVGASNGSILSNTVIRNSVINNIPSGGTQSNNITNAAYEAL